MTLSRVSRLTPGQPSSHMIRKIVWDNAALSMPVSLYFKRAGMRRNCSWWIPKADIYLWPQKCNFVFLFLNIIIFFHFKLLERSSAIFHNLNKFYQRNLWPSLGLRLRVSLWESQTETWKLITWCAGRTNERVRDKTSFFIPSWPS